jgi:probable lipoprotein NlpC
MTKKSILRITVLMIFLSIVGVYPAASQGKKKQKKITTATTFARSFIGTPYRYGGNSKNGIDCSSLIQQSYAKIGVKLPRVTEDQAKVGNRVSSGNVRAGDIVFFKFKEKGEKWWHTGMITQSKKNKIKFIHASSSRGVVEDTYNDYYKKNTKYFRRVIK